MEETWFNIVCHIKYNLMKFIDCQIYFNNKCDSSLLATIAGMRSAIIDWKTISLSCSVDWNFLWNHFLHAEIAYRILIIRESNVIVVRPSSAIDIMNEVNIAEAYLVTNFIQHHVLEIFSLKNNFTIVLQ